jgi:hypothetical protein
VHCSFGRRKAKVDCADHNGIVAALPLWSHRNLCNAYCLCHRGAECLTAQTVWRVLTYRNKWATASQAAVVRQVRGGGGRVLRRAQCRARLHRRGKQSRDVSSVRCASGFGGVQHAAYRIQRAAYNMQHATCSIQYAAYNMQRCSMPHTTCNIPYHIHHAGHATYSMQQCSIRHAAMQHTTCSMQHTIQHATYNMQQCSIRHAKMQHTTCSHVAYNMQQ